MSSPAHIAILEDNEDILQLATLMLKLENHRVTGCKDIGTLNATISSDTPNVIILDMLLSGMDGRDICREIKSNPEISHIPIVIFTAHPNAEASCKEAGANFFLEKPFELEDLYAVINEAINYQPS